MISTTDLSLLPDVDALKNLLQSIALLDAIICREWQYRYYSFNQQWDDEYALASMRNGQGDEYFAAFSSMGAIIKGFVHEAVMSPYKYDPPRLWPGILDQVPIVFKSLLSDPAIRVMDTTFCVWRTYQSTSWQHGDIMFPEPPDADGSAYLLRHLDGNPHSYQKWAEGYYGRDIDLEAVNHIYAHQPLTNEIITILNSNSSMQELAKEIAGIGY
jgi:hypothetical protein